MLTTNQKQILFESMIDILELPDSAYEKAKDRYVDIGEWLGRDESLCTGYNPYIFPQGSFRLGTGIRPLDEREEYDLDLVCKLQTGFTKALFTQKDLKDLIGQEIEGEFPPASHHPVGRSPLRLPAGFRYLQKEFLAFHHYFQGSKLARPVRRVRGPAGLHPPQPRPSSTGSGTAAIRLGQPPAV